MNFALRRPSRRRIAAAIVVVLIAFVLANLFVSSAAQLNLGPISRQHAEVKASCDLDGVALTNSGSPTNGVVVSGIAPGCSGPIIVKVGTNVADLASFEATSLSGGGAQTLTLPSPGTYNASLVTRAAVMIGGWPIKVTWTYTPPASGVACVVTAGVTHWSGNTPVTGPVVPTDSCTVPNLTRATQWTSNGVTYEEWQVSIRNPGPREIVWRLDLNFSIAPFTGFTVRSVSGLGPGSNWGGRAETGCAQLPVMRVVGGNPPWNSTLEPGETVSFNFQISSSAATGFPIACP